MYLTMYLTKLTVAILRQSDGGAMRIQDGKVTISDSLFQDNSAEDVSIMPNCILR